MTRSLLFVVLTAAGVCAGSAWGSGATSLDLKALESRPILNQTPVGTGKWTLEKLLSLTQAEQESMWRKLPPPTLQEMNGHYMGIGPQADNPAVQKSYAAYMYDEKSARGAWQGKAFRPLNATSGEGYNRWRFPGGKIERNLRMATRVQNSIIDGKPCYVLDYSAFNKSTLYDELRKLDDGVYIGAATVAQAGGPNGNGTRSKIDMFILIGPTDEWVGEPYTTHMAPRKAGDAAKK
jgi:hypothetical protein